MPDIHLKQFEFTHNSCETCTKIKERIQNIKETGDSRYIYQNKLDKACFKHNIGYGNFKDLPRRKTSDKVLHNQTVNIAENPTYEVYQRGLASVLFCNMVGR